MRHVLLSASALVVVAGLAACDNGIVVDIRGIEGSGTVVTEARDVAVFSHIRLAGEGRVIASTGEAPSLSIETDDNLMALIESNVRGGVLELATQRGVDIEPSGSVVYRVTAPEITSLTLTGAGSVELDEADVARFEIALSGAGSITVGRLDADHLDVSIAGTGSVGVAGRVTSQGIDVPGAGDFDGSGLESAEATVNASGVGSATVWVTDLLEANVSGVGSIRYYGSPQVAETVTGVGSVNRLGDR